MKVLGIGNTGMSLATKFDNNPVLLSTAHQDSINYKKYNVHTFTEDGAGKRFGSGLKIWNKNENRLKSVFENYVNENVVLFSSLGGGSGSSSIAIISKMLIEQGNKVLVIGILPHRKEVNPPLANAVQSLNSLIPIIENVSVLLFDNQKLLKKFENNWVKVNEHIIKRAKYVTNLIEEFSLDGYSPMTIDRSEHASVVFSGGFLDVTDDFLEKGNPKFDYGKLDAQTKNVLIAMFVDKGASQKKVDEYHTILTNVSNKLSTRAKNARLIPGILRGVVHWMDGDDLLDRAYVTIASGMNVDGYMKEIEKMRDDAMERASNYSTKNKVEKVVSKKETNVLDI